MNKAIATASLAAAISACGGARATPASEPTEPLAQPAPVAAPPRDGWVLVTVESARIAARVQGGDPWDPDTTAAQREGEAASAAALGTALNLAEPGAGSVVQALLSLAAPPPNPDAPASYPDSFVRLTLHERSGPRTVQAPAVVDSVRPTWDFAFYVRTDALDDSGIDVEVLDREVQGAPPRIGGFNVPRARLVEVVSTDRVTSVDGRDHELEAMRLRLDPVHEESAPEPRTIRLPLRDGMKSTGIRVAMGAMVHARATGAGRIGSGVACPADVTPAGRPAGECRRYNMRLGALREAPHGSAVILIGKAPDVQVIDLASGTSAAPEREFAAPTSGELVVAVNDTDFDNNAGEFVFTIGVSPPGERADGP